MADENKNPLFGDFGKMPNFDFTKLMKDFKLPGGSCDDHGSRKEEYRSSD